MKFRRDFETKIIPKLLHKRKLLFSITLILQVLIYFSIFFPLWLVRVKENIDATLIGNNLRKGELKIRISEKDERFFSIGKPVNVFTNNLSVNGIVNNLTQSKDNNFLTVIIENDGSDYTNIPDSGEIKIVTRGKRILEILFERWNGKSIGNMAEL